MLNNGYFLLMLHGCIVWHYSNFENWKTTATFGKIHIKAIVKVYIRNGPLGWPMRCVAFVFSPPSPPPPQPSYPTPPPPVPQTYPPPPATSPPAAPPAPAYPQRTSYPSSRPFDQGEVFPKVITQSIAEFASTIDKDGKAEGWPLIGRHLWPFKK